MCISITLRTTEQFLHSIVDKWHNGSTGDELGANVLMVAFLFWAATVEYWIAGVISNWQLSVFWLFCRTSTHFFLFLNVLCGQLVYIIHSDVLLQPAAVFEPIIPCNMTYYLMILLYLVSCKYYSLSDRCNMLVSNLSASASDACCAVF